MSVTIEACKQMIESKCVEENAKLYEQIKELTAENARLRAALDSLIRQVEPLLVSNGYAHIGAIEVARKALKGETKC